MQRLPVLLAALACHLCCSLAELEFYPGYRRPDPLKWEKVEAEELALAQLSDYLQEQQRRLAMQQAEPDFTYRVPGRMSSGDYDSFAVAPPDPRYYQQTSDDYIAEEEPADQEPVYKEPEVPELAQRVVVDVPVQRSDSARTATRPSGPEAARRHDQHVEVVHVTPSLQDDSAGVYIIAVIAGISAAATVGFIAVGIGWYNLQKNVKNATDVEYPAYGVTGPNKDISPTGDRKLAQSAQMYHYQHQKQQIIAMENRAAAADRHGSLSEVESDEENEEGDYTVYECPGLAPTGEMEVKNPLFQDDPTPAQAPSKDDNAPK